MDDGIQASVKVGKTVDVSFLNQSPVARQIALILENIGGKVLAQFHFQAV